MFYQNFCLLFIILIFLGPLYIVKINKLLRNNGRRIFIRKKDIIDIIINSSLLLISLWIIIKTITP